MTTSRRTSRPTVPSIPITVPRIARAMLALVAFAAHVASPAAAAASVLGVSMTDPSLVSDTAGGTLEATRGDRLSGDGRWLVFVSSRGSLLLPGYSGSGQQVFLFDRLNNHVQLVSRRDGLPQQGANGHSSQPVVSGDGAYVGFQSTATDLVPGGSGAELLNVYVWSRATGTVELVSESVATAGQSGNDDSLSPVFSSDGAYVSFESDATDLVAGGSGPASVNVYVWSRATGSVDLVSRSWTAAGQRGDGDSYQPVISADGSHVAFQSSARDLISPGGGPLTQNVYLWSRAERTVELVSESTQAADYRGNGDSYWPQISEDGGYVAFYGYASDLIARDWNFTQDVFLRRATADVTAPSDPTIDSTSPPPSTWSNDSTVEATWSGAADDPGGSGLAGYSIEWSQSAVSTPDAIVDVPHVGDPHAATSAPLTPDGENWYLHLRTCDMAGNCTAAVHAGPFWIDTTAPAAPTGLASGSHVIGAISELDTIAVTWSPATDDGAGIDGYSWAFTPEGNWTCETAKDGEEGNVVASSGPLAGGIWHFHLCALDNAGNWSGVASLGPFLLTGTALPQTCVLPFEASWGLFGSGPGELRRPFGVATSPDGEVYVADLENNRLQVFDALGTYLREWPTAFWPTSVGRDAHGHLAVASLGDARIELFDPVGGLIRQWATGNPYGLAVDDSDHVHAVNDLSNLVSEYDHDGTFVGQFGSTGSGDGQFLRAWGIAAAPGRGLFVTDMYGNTVQRFTSDGAFAARWGTFGTAEGQLYGPSGVAVSPGGMVYVAEAGNNRIQAFTLEGFPLCSWGSAGSGAGEFDQPLHLAFAGGHLYVADQFNHRIQKFGVDAETPGGPTSVASTSHTPGVWSSVTTISMNWSGASDDPHGSGLAGYSVIFDSEPGAEPDDTIEIGQVGDPHVVTSPALGDGAWYFHLRACDGAANCSPAAHSGVFLVDSSAPTPPGAVISASHGDGAPRSDTTIDIGWSAATDGYSGVAGYRYGFTAGAAAPACGDLGATTGGTSASSDPLGEGTWYAHVCAMDVAGNEGAVTSGGPYVIDLSAPHVANVDSVASSGGAIGEGEIVGVEIVQLLVTFDEAMDEPLAESLDGYLLVEAGGDGTLETSDCSGAAGSDVLVAIDTGAYAGTTTTLGVNGGVALPAGLYRLLACPTLQDVAGHVLDGDGDGTGGDAFVRSFAVDLAPPTVVLIDTTAASAGAGLEEHEPTNVAITLLHVTFGEPVHDPIGDTDPNDVTNPANYLLIAAGGDGFQTVSCQTGAHPADVALAFDGVTYEGSTRTATLLLAGGTPLGEELYRLFICGTDAIVDLAGLPLDGDGDGTGGDDFVRNFQVDTTAPSNPVLLPSLPIGSWTNLAGITVIWSGAEDDPGGGGLAGYAVLFDLASGSDPGTGIDVPEAMPHQASTILGDGATHYFHLRACDRAGTCAAPVESGPFRVDTQVPSTPTGLTSPSHDVGVASNDPTIEVTWLPAEDQPGLSGIDGYDFAFVPGGTELCDLVKDGEETTESAVSLELQDGEWWFRICAGDNAGNWGVRASIGPFVIDTSASVAAVGTVADTGNGVLEEGESTIGGITQFFVAFDGVMADPPGDSAPEDVTNPENFRLYEAGVDGAVSTVACGAPTGDDVEVMVASSEYLAASRTAVLRFASIHALGAGAYRLLICPTLEDEAGNALTAFQRDFVVTSGDRLANPNFDDGLSEWVVTDPVPGSLAWSAADAGDAPSSGSAEIVAVGTPGAVWGLSQCFELPVGPFHGRARALVESVMSGAPEIEMRLDFFDATACTGSLLDSSVSPPIAGDTGGLWSVVEFDRPAEPVASQAVLVTARVVGGGAASFIVRIDDLFYGRMPGLFSDGFETGDCERWSTVVGLP